MRKDTLFLKFDRHKKIKKKQVNIRTRAEIKAIENTLNYHQRLVNIKHLEKTHRIKLIHRKQLEKETEIKSKNLNELKN